VAILTPYDPRERVIPNNRYLALKKETGLIIPHATMRQKKHVKTILGMSHNFSFPLCRRKSKNRVKKLEALGDYTHSHKNHLCNKCRCGYHAGWGTKGDFYGLGPETGHIGVGLCWKHSWKLGTKKTIEMCDLEVKLMKMYGDAIVEEESMTDKMIKAENELALERKRGREDISLVVSQLNTFKDKLDEESLEEYVSGGKDGAVLAKMSDKTRIGLALDIAKAISKLDLEHFKMDKASYIHYDELATRIPKVIDLATMCFGSLSESIANHKQGNEDPIDMAIADFRVGYKKIWRGAKHGAK